MTQSVVGLQASSPGVPQWGVPLVRGDLVLCLDPASEVVGAPGVVVDRSPLTVWVDGRRVCLPRDAWLRCGATVDVDALLAGDADAVRASLRLDGEPLADRVPPAVGAPVTGSVVMQATPAVRLGYGVADTRSGDPVLTVNWDGMLESVPADAVSVLGVVADVAALAGFGAKPAFSGALVVRQDGADREAPRDDPDFVAGLARLRADPELDRLLQECAAQARSRGVDRSFLGWFAADVARQWDALSVSSRQRLLDAVEDAQAGDPRVAASWLQDFLEVLALHREWAGGEAGDIDRLAGPVGRAHLAAWRQRRAAAEGDH